MYKCMIVTSDLCIILLQISIINREMNKQQYLYRRAQQTENQFGVQGTIHDLIEQVKYKFTT